MTGVFYTVLQMSGYGLIAAAVVMALMLLFWRTRASKTALLLLWLVVGFRLICPWSPPSALSLFNLDTAERYAGLMADSGDQPYYAGEKDGVEHFETMVGNGSPVSEGFKRGVEAGAKPVQNAAGSWSVRYLEDGEGNITVPSTVRETWGPALSWVWLAGCALFALYGAVSYLMLRRRLRFAVRDEAADGVWLSDYISSPCVAGLIRPRIYLTFGMGEGEREYVLAHERQHIKNGDHLWKVLGWLVMCVHWFNPLLWVVYWAFLWTLEEACDQRVLRELGEGRRADYGQALLSLSSEKRFRPGFSPLAFGEGDTKDRVKTILKYKKPLAWLTAVALVLGTAVGVCVLTGRAEREEDGGIEDVYGTYQIDGVVHLTPASSVTTDYLLETLQGQKIIVNAQFFSGDGVEVVNPRYEPMEVGDTLATLETEDEQLRRMSTLGLTRYRSVRGWKVLRHDGTQTGKHIFSLDGELWLGDWKYHDNAAKPYGEYWVIFSAERAPSAVTDGIEGAYGAYQVDALRYLTPLSSLTPDYYLEQYCDGAEIVFTKEMFSVGTDTLLYTGEDGVTLENPTYEPLDSGQVQQALETARASAKSIQGWSVLDSGGNETSWRVFAVDGRLWVGVYVPFPYADSDAKSYVLLLDCARVWTDWEGGGAQGLASPGLVPAGDTVYWEYRPDEAFGSPGFPFQFLFHAECNRFELACESGELLLCSHSYSGLKIRGRGNVLTVDASDELVYWSPVSGDGGDVLTSDEIAVKVWQDSEVVFTARISIELAERTETGYSYRARAALSDTEHFFFEKEDGDPDQVYAQLIGGPDYYPPFTFTAEVTAVDPGEETMTVRPDKPLAGGVEEFEFFKGLAGTYEVGGRVIVTARQLIAGPDEVRRGVGTFGQVDEVVPLTPSVVQWRADLTHDGTDELVSVTNYGGEYAGVFFLIVESAAEDAAPEVLWRGEAATSHAGQNGFYLYRDTQDGRDYLLNWVSYMGMGFADYRYSLFSLSPQGEEQVVREGSLSFDLYDLWSGDPEQMRAFDDEINALLEESVVLLSTNGDTPERVYYGDPDEPVRPIGPFVSEAEHFEKDQALAQGEYTFLGEITNKRDDCIVLVSTTLWWGDGRDWQYQFVIPNAALVDGAENYQEGGTVSVTADGPLYRSAFPDEGTHVEVRLISAGPAPEPSPAQQPSPAVSPAAS